MDVKEIIDSISKMVRENHEGKVLFDSPIIIKPSPHSYPLRVYGIEIAPYGDVWVMSTGEKLWHQLKTEDKNSLMVASSVMQRLKLLEARAQKI